MTASTKAAAGIPLRLKLQLGAAAIVCAAFGVCAIVIYAIYFARHPWQDWMVYYAAARAYFDDNLPMIFDGARFTAHLDAYFAAWLTEPFTFRTFVYPPNFLLLLIPFGLVGFAASCVLFEVVTFAGLLAAIGQYVRYRGRRILHVLSLALAPPVWFNLVTGQNGFLTAALLIGGFGVLPRQPALAGVLLGVLTYKPQFWLLVPVALVAAGQWRVLTISIGVGVGIALASLAVFGIELWLAWLHWALNPPPADYQRFLECCRLHDESVFTNLALVGAPTFAANIGQLAATVLAAVPVWWCYRRAMAPDLRLAVLLAATMLAAPHASNYDAVLLVVAATLVFGFGLDHGFRRGGVTVPLLTWVIQLFNPPDAFRIGLMTPLVTVLLILCAVERGWAAALPPAASAGEGLPAI